MDHRPSETRTLIDDTINPLLRREYPDGHRAEANHAGERVARLATALGEGGWFGLCAGEAAGGGGLDLVDALPVAVAAGFHALPLPLCETLLAARLLSAQPPHHAKARALATGTEFACFADGAAAQLASGGTLSGQWETVTWAPQARWLLLPAMVEGAERQLLVDLADPHVTVTRRTSLDIAASIACVRIDRLDVAADAMLDAAGTRSRRALLAAAEMQGALARALDMTVAYLNEREQFGKVIGSFQSLKHIAANAALVLENLTMANDYAAWAVSSGAPDAEEAVLVAKAWASDNAHRAAQDMVQLHGSIGFTWELGLHALLRRILRLRASAGTAAECNEALVREVERALSEHPA